MEAKPLVLRGQGDTNDDGIPYALAGTSGPYPHLSVGLDDSSIDTDGDGSTDREEIENRTDLYDSSDRLQLLSIEPLSGSDPNLLLTARTFPGLAYQFESSNSLEDLSTIPGSTFTATDFISEFFVTIPGDRAFIRIRRGVSTTQFASEVHGFSSQYSDDAWSATQALGEPDLYPNYGDLPEAWAPLEPDHPKGEFLELGFSTPVRAASNWIPPASSISRRSTQ